MFGNLIVIYYVGWGFSGLEGLFFVRSVELYSHKKIERERRRDGLYSVGIGSWPGPGLPIIKLTDTIVRRGKPVKLPPASQSDLGSTQRNLSYHDGLSSRQLCTVLHMQDKGGQKL